MPCVGNQSTAQPTTRRRGRQGAILGQNQPRNEHNNDYRTLLVRGPNVSASALLRVVASLRHANFESRRAATRSRGVHVAADAPAAPSTYGPMRRNFS